ncbi:MAG: uncharacterized protein QOD95_2384 [Gammaproteobacteria bacterium]|nr:uncharacterized protein [Gammaproteobacteria bacterium]
MVITFDLVRREKNLHDRQLDFLDAEIVLSGLLFTVEDTRIDYGEQRFQTVGFLTGRMVMVVWTPRGEAAHVMSMRKCNDKEQARYSKRFEEG